MRADGWYPDPGLVHELRYFDHEQWTAFVSDHGLVGQDVLDRPSRRRWPWVVGPLAVVTALVLATLAVAGMDRATDDLDVYVQDLTTTHAGFPASTTAESATAWTSAGYRMTVLVPDGSAAGGIISPTPHAVLALKIDVVPQEVPVGAELGVQCWQSEARGYALLVSSDGAARLASGSVLTGELTTLSSATVAPLRTGVPRTLTLACDVVGSEAVLAGYVDGTRVLTAHPSNALSEIDIGGMVVTAGGAAPASWTVTRFERMGVHNMPDGWRG